MSKTDYLTEDIMKKTLIILIALIATASLSFGATGNDYQITPSAESMQLEEYLDNYATTYHIQADQERTAGAIDFKAINFNDAAQTEGLFAVYSVDNLLIDTTDFDRSTSLEGYLAQVEQAQKLAMDEHIVMEKVEINETCGKC
jgi:hypothetical protein